MTERDVKGVQLERTEYFRRLLCPLWLRPETALWYAHEAFLARQYLGEFSGPSMEFGCFEGVPSFVMLGGEFNIQFDVYSEVSWNESSHVWKSHADDYYNKADPGPVENVQAATTPSVGFDVGLSWKPAHLIKAARLGIHKRLVDHDPAEPLSMFEADSFETIWAPNLYWLDNFRDVFGELRRILRPGGNLVTPLPSSEALDLMIGRWAGQADPDWIRDLDRGRFANVSRQARSLEDWYEFLEESGFRVQRHDWFLPKLAFEVNDIGMRPMFPVFMRVYETLREDKPEEWLEIKRHWIDTVFHFMSPLCELEWMEKLEIENVWHMFQLTPKGAA